MLALPNNDIEVVSHDWLEEMVGIAARPDVGAVGARLWFADGTLQHAGVVLGIGGVAGHLHRRLSSDVPGYLGRARPTQEFSAVTTACLVLRREIVTEIGGLDERNLAVEFNDFDFCLRVHRAGYRIVWAPHAELIHHVSVSRGRRRSVAQQQRFEAEVAYMQKRWRHELQHDPAYNPNFSLDVDTAQLRAAPRVDLIRPWFLTDGGIGITT